MRTALETLGMMGVMLLLLAPMAILAKDEKRPATGKGERRAERDGNKLVEKIKDTARSKGTNIVYRTGRTFPLMFSRSDKAKENGRAGSPKPPHGK